ncbi:MAG: hypothetical protein C5B50_08100 [Verrucomicrobia bacterium]|nr:MAG: hypothetical protein C5B50_08100 [Verrucomicrobiota bacterium]
MSAADVRPFREKLERSGYRQFYLSFGDANFRIKDWPIGARDLSGDLRDLVKLFLLQEALPRESATKLLGSEFTNELIECGILVGQPSIKDGTASRFTFHVSRFTHLVSNSFFLIFCRSHALFCQMSRHPMAYFGDDSLALISFQTPAPGGNVLDLCCGPGIQSFVAAAYAAKVTGVEIRPETWRVAELNRRLNDAAERVKFVCSSAEQFARKSKEKFDRIIFNPPLVPVPPGFKYVIAGDGGPDGLTLTRRIINLYSNRISRHGSLEFIGAGLGRKDHATVCEQIKSLARRNGLSGRIHLLSQHPIKPHAPLFEAYVMSMALENKMEVMETRKIIHSYFSRLGHDAYFLFFTSLYRDRGAAKSISTINMTKNFWGSWFV